MAIFRRKCRFQSCFLKVTLNWRRFLRNLWLVPEGLKKSLPRFFGHFQKNCLVTPQTAAISPSWHDSLKNLPRNFLLRLQTAWKVSGEKIIRPSLAPEILLETKALPGLVSVSKPLILPSVVAGPSETSSTCFWGDYWILWACRPFFPTVHLHGFEPGTYFWKKRNLTHPKWLF